MSDAKSATMGDRISSEVTEKSYTVDQGTSKIKHAVRIETTRSQEVALAEEDKNKIDQTRIYPDQEITKVVWIDNDSDSEFDEKLKFRYTQPHGADGYSDFVLVTNRKEIFVAIDEGESLRILESASFSTEEAMSDDRENFVFTDDNGKEINFYIENFERMNAKGKSSL